MSPCQCGRAPEGVQTSGCTHPPVDSILLDSRGSGLTDSAVIMSLGEHLPPPASRPTMQTQTQRIVLLLDPLPHLGHRELQMHQG